MSVTGSSQWMKLGVWGLIFTFLLTVVGEEAFAAKRRGKGGGVRRPGRVQKARGKARGGKRRGGGRVARRGRGGIGNGIAALPADGNGGGNNNNGLAAAIDLGPASAVPNFNQIALGLQPVNGFSNLGRSSDGRFFELNPGSVVNGAFVVDPNAAIRQPMVDLNGSIIAGQNVAILPGTAEQIRLLNAGVIPAAGSQFVGIGGVNLGGVGQVRSIRRNF